MQLRQAGFTVLELLIGTSLALILLGLVYFFFEVQNKIFIKEEKRLPVEHSARIGVNAIVRDMRMAGFRRGSSTTFPIFGTTTTATFRRYTTATGVTTAIDISYSVNNGRLIRNGPSGETFITGNVDGLTFAFRNITGNITTNWNNVRKIDVTLKTKVQNPGTAFGAYSSYSLTESVTPPNLAQ